MENNQSIKKSKEHQTNTKSVGIEAASGQTRFKFFVTSEVITEHTEYMPPIDTPKVTHLHKKPIEASDVKFAEKEQGPGIK